MGRKIVCLCTAVLLFTCAMVASAEELDFGRTGSVSVTLKEQYAQTPIAGAQLSIYYIATVGINTNGQLNYVYTKQFAETGIAMEDADFADQLDAYLSANDMPSYKLFTNAEGTATCENMPLGLYFIRQTNTVEGFAPCKSFLVTLPMQNDEGYVYAVNASPKTEVTRLTSITVKKVWNTDEFSKHSDSVTVQLLHNQTVVHTATLSASNNWQVIYTDMPESDAYSIKEVDVPRGFTATYRQKGYVFTVTNTSTLIQTGQLIWPIPVLAFAGVLLIAAGSVLLQKKRKQNA